MSPPQSIQNIVCIRTTQAMAAMMNIGPQDTPTEIMNQAEKENRKQDKIIYVYTYLESSIRFAISFTRTF